MAKNTACPTERTLDLISGRWKVMVIYWLLTGNRRFNQLHRHLDGIRTARSQSSYVKWKPMAWWSDWISRKFRRALNIASPRKATRSSPFWSPCMIGPSRIQRPNGNPWMSNGVCTHRFASR